MKKLLTAMLGVTMCASVATGVTMMASAEPVDSSDWTLASGTLTTQWDENTGAYVIGATSESAWGARAYLNDPVKVDGLTLEFYSDSYEASACMGIGFVSPSSPSDYSPQNANSFGVNFRPGFNSEQTRFTVSKSHDSNAAIGSTTIGGDVVGAFGSSSVYQYDGTATAVGAKYVINYLEDSDVYQVDYTMTYGTGFQTQASETTLYVAKEYFTSVMNSDGEVVISAYGMSNKAATLLVKITEDEEEGSVPETDEEAGEDVESEESEVTLLDNLDVTGRGSNSVDAWAKYELETGATVFSPSVYGDAFTFERKVNVDGLVVELYTDTFTANGADCIGFSFVKDLTAFGPETANTYHATFWPGLYGQGRFVQAASHAHGGGIIYDSADKAADPDNNTVASTFWSSFVYNNSDELGMKLTFTYLEEKDVYQVDMEMTAGAAHSQQATTRTGYFPASYVKNAQDDDGLVYLSLFGFTSNAEKPVLKIIYSDSELTKYENGVRVAFVEKLNAYQTAVKAIVDADSYEASLVAQAQAKVAVESLSDNDKALAAQYLAEIDALYTTDADVQANVKAAVQDTYDVAINKLAAFEDESSINKMSLNDYKASVEQANAKYAEMKTMLTAENQEYFEGLSEDLAYGADLITVKSWVISYESMADALDATAETIIEDINAAKEYKLAFAGSATESLLNTLEAEDIEALNERIAAADETVAAMEARFSVEVKDELLSVVETALEEDLTIKFNLDDAKNAWTDLNDKVTITEEDVELYTRYTEAYAALKAACEAYVTAEINAVSDALENEFTAYSAFKSVRDRYYLIRLNYLYEENADVTAAYEAVSAKIKENIWFNVTTTDITEVEWTEGGLYFEQTPAFPSRLNWNQQLNLVTGAEIVVEMTEAAYYNDGSSANNLCFNFLAAPDSYKSTSDGISIIVWLFPTESKVEVFNHNDTGLANKTISTPMDGATIAISVKYTEYYDFVADNTYYAYVIKVNEAEIVLTEAQLTQYGYEISNDCYFSMGSFADRRDYPNKLTLVSVNGKELGYVEPDNGDEGGNESGDVTPAPQPQPQPTEKEEEGGCGSVIGGVSAVIAILGAAAVVLKKKEN